MPAKRASQRSRNTSPKEAQRAADDSPALRLALSPEQAAQALGVSRVTLWRMVRRGEIKTFHVGRRRLVPVAVLEAFIAEQVELESA
jgi:excisionase family DNA binding protein